MNDHHFYRTLDRVQQRLDLLGSYVYGQRAPLDPFRVHILSNDARPADPESTHRHLTATNADDSAWPTLHLPDHWAPARTRFVLRTRFTVPPGWGDDGPLALFFPLGEAVDFCHPEALVHIDGQPLAGTDRFHHEVALPARYADGQPHSLALHGWTGIGMPNDESRLYAYPPALVRIDQALRDLLALARVTLSVARRLPDADPTRLRLLDALRRLLVTLDTREPLADSTAFRDSIAPAYVQLKADVAAAGSPLNADVFAAGHAHIDTAWLWTLDQTRSKVARTFHTVLHLMQQFPDYTFTQSQPQLYAYLREAHPDAFAQIQQRVAEGRWEPIGGMWVEADCNVTGPESLVRQFLLGRSFFREHFGPDAESPVVWLPDTFGFNAALPQLFKLAGMDYFFSTKISWNQTNRFPYDSFWWQGIDGTRILTHFTPTPLQDDQPMTTYNAAAAPDDPLRSWRHFQNREQDSSLLMVYGWGDGGGGPTREMLENIRELKAFPGSPRTRHAPALDFFRRLESESAAHLPTWAGELYLEIHRGTYTSQARNKRANRHSEFALHDAEFLAAYASLLHPDYRYPHAALNAAWALVCLNQFHDILPGSSINAVYADSQDQYAQVLAQAAQVQSDAAAALAARLGGTLLVVNPTSLNQRGMVHWAEGALHDGQHLRCADDQPIRTQPAADGGLWLETRDLSPYSLSALSVHDGPLPDAEDNADPLSVSQIHLENKHLRAEFDAAGDLVRLVDKTHGRELLPEGARANQWQVYEDRPLNWDAWDIDASYEQERLTLAAPATQIDVIEAGPLRAALRITRQIGSSPYTQTVSLEADSPLLRFDTHIDWQERHALLKTAFPLALDAARAAFDIPWGHVERPTHRNTAWEWARFEVPMQKWADLSETGYGVSLLNDGKYGIDVQGNIMRLSLLRAPTDPDPNADQGHHQFSYGLLLHDGPLGVATQRAAYAFNAPLRVVPSTGTAPTNSLPPLIEVSDPSVVVETVKRSEDGSGWIVRLYESQRARVHCRLQLGVPAAHAEVVDLLEAPLSPLTLESTSALSVTLRPFQILSIKLYPSTQ